MKFVYYTATENDLFSLNEALHIIKKEYGDIIEVVSRGAKQLKQEEVSDFVKSADAFIGIMHGGEESLPHFNKIIEELGDTPRFFYADSSSITTAIENSNIPKDIWKKLFRYYKCSGGENMVSFLFTLMNYITGEDYPVKDAFELPMQGVYNPDFSDFGVEIPEKEKITFGIIFHRVYWVENNCEFVEDMTREIKKSGHDVIAVYGFENEVVDMGIMGMEELIDTYFFKDGVPVIDVLIDFFSFSKAQNDFKYAEKIFKKLNVPVIKGICSFQSRCEWEESFLGLSVVDITVSVATPEIDGDIISIPQAFLEEVEPDSTTGIVLKKYKSEPERLKKLIAVALKWARLSKIKNSEKKIAILFHNYPPKDHSIGTAFGLDSPKSVVNLLKEMKDRGFTIGEIPETGDDLIKKLMEFKTIDRESFNEKPYVDEMDYETYMENFNALHPDIKGEMIENFGEPLGEVVTNKGNIGIPGMISGNIFIGIQPERGFLMDSKMLHNPTLPIPHFYLAYYRWIRDIFKADAVYHIGKHGSLEWLPGKSVGLSEKCYPDLVLSDLPNIYPYLINDPGEGIQAKRRSAAVIIDHLTPIMVEAGLYETYEEIEREIAEYERLKSINSDKISMQEEIIDELANSVNLYEEMGIERENFKDYSDFLLEIHIYLESIKDSMIKSGLHIMGEPPQGERLSEYLPSLVRYQNREIPSLRTELFRLKGYENFIADDIKDNKSLKIFESVINEEKEIFREWFRESFDYSKIDGIIEKVLGHKSAEIKKILEFVALTLIPNLNKTREEIIIAVDGAEGKFVPAGESGAPTRGEAHILPTGRNFFSINPNKIPTETAWETGKQLADGIIERYLKEEGKYPESIGITVWATPAMRTGGDDIAEIFYLLGVKPLWNKENGYVREFEIIPLSELKRPRIDVTVRISGLFRDAFPNVTEILHKAVLAVSNLNEDISDNFIKKHIKEEMNDMIKAGVSEEDAFNEAAKRIFGCKPGGYGAGVNQMILSKDWEGIKDLAEIYVEWGGYAYGGDNKGDVSFEAFKQRLSSMDIAIKNIDTHEVEIMDCDDYYAFHGGMITAVKAFRGEEPKGYIGDSSEIRAITRNVKEESIREFRTRLFNPKWIESMKEHGYKGAGDMANIINNAFGWHVTGNALNDNIFEEISERYLFSKDIAEWMEEVNPWARKEIAERLLEAIKRGLFNPKEDTGEKIRSIYLETEGLIESEIEVR